MLCLNFLPSLVYTSNLVSSEYFNVQAIVFLNFCFDCNLTPPPPRLTMVAEVIFRLVSTEPVPDMKTASDTENQLLHKTPAVLKPSVHEKGVVGHSPRYSRTNTLFEIVKTFLLHIAYM